ILSSIPAPTTRLRIVQKLRLLSCLTLQHPLRVFRQPCCFGPVPAGSIAGHLSIRLWQQAALTLLAVTKELCPPFAAAVGGESVFVLGKLDDPIQFLAEGHLHALIGTSRDLGMGKLLIGNEVAFLKAVSVATQRLGV
ncbi:hypothetical protein GOODEAATRI_014260, partial [Goodea atripinnis]